MILYNVFPSQSNPHIRSSRIALVACKTYARGLVFITVYQEGSFYIVMQEGEGDQVRLLFAGFVSGKYIEHYTTSRKQSKPQPKACRKAKTAVSFSSKEKPLLYIARYLATTMVMCRSVLTQSHAPAPTPATPIDWAWVGPIGHSISGRISSRPGASPHVLRRHTAPMAETYPLARHQTM